MVGTDDEAREDPVTASAEEVPVAAVEEVDSVATTGKQILWP